MANITLRVNGRAHTVNVEPSTPLLYVLRNDLGLQGPRFGCGLGQCGACTVIINGTATRSCVTPTSSVRGEITTLEGLAKDGTLHTSYSYHIGESSAKKDEQGRPLAKSIKHAHFNEAWVMQGN